MCGRFHDTHDLAELKASFKISGKSAPDYHVRYNIAPMQSALVIRETGDSRDMEMMRWGLIPHWAKDAKIGSRMINARAETVREKRAGSVRLNRFSGLVGGAPAGFRLPQSATAG